MAIKRVTESLIGRVWTGILTNKYNLLIPEIKSLELDEINTESDMHILVFQKFRRKKQIYELWTFIIHIFATEKMSIKWAFRETQFSF